MVLTLDGGKGNDRLVASKGIEILKGGKGKDMFVLRAGKGYSVIEDFQKGKDSVVIEFERKNLQIRKVDDGYQLKNGNDLLALIEAKRLGIAELGL